MACLTGRLITSRVFFSHNAGVTLGLASRSEVMVCIKCIIIDEATIAAPSSVSN